MGEKQQTLTNQPGFVFSRFLVDFGLLLGGVSFKDSPCSIRTTNLGSES